MKTITCLKCALTCLAVAVAAVARADVLELVNGDHYSGTVISMTPTNIEFRSEVQGVVRIPRDKVAAINLRPAPRVVKNAGTNAPSAGTNSTQYPTYAPGAGANAGFNVTLHAPTGAAATSSGGAAQTDAVIQQLRGQGVDPNMMNQIQQQVLGTSSPEATRMFNEMVAGLQSGSVSVSDIRNKAQKAITDIQAVKKDLGGEEAEMLDSYLTILEKFVNEGSQPAGSTTAAKTAVPATGK